MFHPYKNGYSLLPQLKKIDKKDIFFHTNNIQRYIDEKKKSINIQKCFLEHDINQEIYNAASQFILDNHYLKLEEPHDFCNLAMQIPEDLAIHRISESTDWLAATHVCIPGAWSPEEKIGLTFDEIHTVIPGMNLKNSRKIVEAMVYNGPYERFVWGLVYEDELNYHPSIKRRSFDINNPFFLLKVERQITVGLPKHNAMLFVLRHFLIPENEIDLPLLYKSLKDMTPEQKKYKGISEEIIDYLRSKTIVNQILVSS